MQSGSRRISRLHARGLWAELANWGTGNGFRMSHHGSLDGNRFVALCILH